MRTRPAAPSAAAIGSAALRRHPGGAVALRAVRARVRMRVCVRVRGCMRVCARARRWWFCSRIRSNLVGMGNMNRKDFLQRAQVHSEGPCQAFVPPTGDRGGTLGMHRPAGATGGAPGHPHSASGAAGPGQSCPRSEGACSGLAGASQRLCVLSDPVLGAVSSRRGHRLLMLKQVL